MSFSSSFPPLLFLPLALPFLHSLNPNDSEDLAEPFAGCLFSSFLLFSKIYTVVTTFTSRFLYYLPPYNLYLFCSPLALLISKIYPKIYSVFTTFGNLLPNSRATHAGRKRGYSPSPSTRVAAHRRDQGRNSAQLESQNFSPPPGSLNFLFSLPPPPFRLFPPFCENL